MDCFIRVAGIAAPMPDANINTDVIMPRQFLKGIDRAGLARGLFHDLRFDGEGAPRADFILNRPGMADARFLVTGPNFGCGSSREHAIWGLLQYGVRAIIGTSFAGIFADNAANNGLLLITLDPEALEHIAGAVADGQDPLTIDLERERIEMGEGDVPFAIDPARRRALMSGLDRIGETLTHSDAIRAFQNAYFEDHPWLVEERAI